jgi:hypothetical protein
MPEQWPELRDALRELLAVTVLDPPHALDPFSQWCEEHASVIQAMCIVEEWVNRVPNENRPNPLIPARSRGGSPARSRRR